MKTSDKHFGSQKETLEYPKATVVVVNRTYLPQLTKDIFSKGTCLHYDAVDNQYRVCNHCFNMIYDDPNIIDFRFKDYFKPDYNHQ